jgi:hypothetical protein
VDSGFELCLRHLDLCPQLLDLLVGDERRIRLLEREQPVVVALRLREGGSGLRNLGASRSDRRRRPFSVRDVL